MLTENYRPISPPAEYAADSGKNESRSRYINERGFQLFTCYVMVLCSLLQLQLSAFVFTLP